MRRFFLGFILAAMTTTGSSAAPAEPKTTIIKGADLEAAFAKSKSFLETPEYRISTARREGPGDVEVHNVDTDIFYVVEGTATLVTGGEMLEPRTTGPNEIRGSSIKGGETKTVGKGDIIVIPKLVPHWFKEVPGPFVYLVIKSTSTAK
jgi:mannose-6-phosphate isomerase-like protein (cupin superfamily)